MPVVAPLPLALTRTQCCVCTGRDAVPVGVGTDFEYDTCTESFVAMRCAGCGLVYLDPRPADDELDRIYPADYHAFNFSEQDFGLIHRIRSRLEARRLLRWCTHLREDSSVLDIGCGDGFHLDLLRRYGNPDWKLFGVDTNRDAVEAAKTKSLEVRCGDAASMAATNASEFDLILLIMTIEHVARPDELLATARQLLKPGGRLVIVTDNSAAVDAQWFKDGYWGGYHFPRHWNLFDSASLTRLAEKSGFEVASLTTAMSPVNWVYSIHNFLVSFKAPSWLINRFTLRSFVSLSLFSVFDGLLNAFGRGSILHAILQKPKPVAGHSHRPEASQ